MFSMYFSLIGMMAMSKSLLNDFLYIFLYGMNLHIKKKWSNEVFKKPSLIIDYWKSARDNFTNLTMLIPKMQSIYFCMSKSWPPFLTVNDPGRQIQVNDVTSRSSIAPRVVKTLPSRREKHQTVPPVIAVKAAGDETQSSRPEFFSL